MCSVAWTSSAVCAGVSAMQCSEIYHQGCERHQFDERAEAAYVILVSSGSL